RADVVKDAWSDLLDGREQPIAAAAADEGPHLFGFDRGARVAADEVIRIAWRTAEADDVVEGAPAHIGGGGLPGALLPAFRQIALHERYVGDDVLRPLASVAGQLLGKIAQHLGRHQPTQTAEIAGAPGLLNRGVNLLEGIEVGIGEIGVAPAVARR